LLATLGVLKRPSLRTWASDLDVLRTGDGRLLPPCLKAELDRLRRRLLMTLEMIREVEAAREQAMEAHDTPANQTVKRYVNSGSWRQLLSRSGEEVFYRTSTIGGRLLLISASRQRRSKAAGWIATGVLIEPATVAHARPWSNSSGYGCAISRRAAWRGGSAHALESLWAARGG
jgi:hypothetical protein